MLTAKWFMRLKVARSDSTRTGRHMDVELVSQLAGAVAVLALIGCFIAASLAFQFSSEMAGPAGAASQLVGRTALLGGGAVIGRADIDDLLVAARRHLEIGCHCCDGGG